MTKWTKKKEKKRFPMLKFFKEIDQLHDDDARDILNQKKKNNHNELGRNDLVNKIKKKFRQSVCI